MRQFYTISMRLGLWAACCLFTTASFAQGSIASDGGKVEIDFDGSTAGILNGTFLALDPNGIADGAPVSGQLDENGVHINDDMPSFMDVAAVFGMGTSTNIQFRGTSPGGVGASGNYAFDVDNSGGVNRALGFQPSGSRWGDGVPVGSDDGLDDGHIVFKFDNNSGVTLTAFRVQFKIYENNNEPRSSTIESYLTIDVATPAYGPVRSTYATPIPSSGIPINWVNVDNVDYIVSTGVNVPNGSSIYLRFYIFDSGGAGTRDEFAIDDISVQGASTPAGLGDPCDDSVASPTITCPGTQTRSLDGNCNYLVEDFTGLASASDADNCPAGVTVTQSPTAGMTFNGDGNTVITLTATDGAGNMTDCMFTLSLVDDSPPTFTCPSAMTVNTNGSPNCSVDIPDFSVLVTDEFDNCGLGANTLQQSIPAGAFNSSGHGTTITVDLTLEDNAVSGSSGPTTVWDESVDGDLASGGGFSGNNVFTPITLYEGVNIITGTLANIFVVNGGTDADALSFTVPAGASVTALDAALTFQYGNTSSSFASFSGSPLSYIMATSSSSSTIDLTGIFGGSPLSPGDYGLLIYENIVEGVAYEYSITCTGCPPPPATGSGNTAVPCSVELTVVDVTAPNAVCANITVQLDNTGNASTTTGDVDGGTTDNCGIASLSANPTSFNCGNVGGNTVTLTATDVNGNTSSCNANVTVENNNPPTAVCADFTVQIDASGNPVSVNASAIDAGSSDNCGITSRTINGSASITVDCSDVGTPVMAELEVFDAGGLSDVCDAVIIVQDVEPPTFTCPTAMTVNTNGSPNCSVDIPDFSVLVTDEFDNCGLGTNTLQQSIPAGAFNSSGHGTTITVDLTLEDNAVSSGSGSTLVWDESVDGDLASGGGFSDNNVFTPITLYEGVNIITGTLANIVGVNGGTNADALSFTVPAGASVTALDAALTFQNGNTSSNFASFSGSPLSYITATFTSSSTIDLTGIFGGSPLSPGDYGLLISENIVEGVAYEYSITCTGCPPPPATGSGNTAVPCSVELTVVDVTAPNAVCANITVQLDNTGNASTTTGDVDGGTTDNCGIASLSANPTSFNCGNVGGNTVVLTATDVNGNSSSCNANVTVENNNPPTAVCADFTVDIISYGSMAFLNANDIDGGSSSACGTVSLGIDQSTFTCSETGVNMVTLTVTDDGNGETASCTANVTVEDPNSLCNAPPVAVCQDITVDADYHCEGNAAAEEFDNGSSDPDGDPITFSVSPEGPYTSGTTMVTLTVDDGNGGTDDCPATITVEDNTPPLFCGDSNASASDYDDGWQSGDNDGEGFGPWALTTSTNDPNQAGHFTGNSTFNGDGDNNGDGDINTAGDRAWGMYANNGNNAMAIRNLSQDLTVGSTLRLKIDNGFVDPLPSNWSFQTLSNNGSTPAWYFRFDGGDSEYKILDGTSIPAYNIPVPFTDEGVEIELTVLSMSEVRFTIRSLDASNPAVYSAVTTLRNAGFIDQIRLSNNNAGMDPPRDLFINDLSVCYADYDFCPDDIVVDANTNCQAVASYSTTLFDNCVGEVPVQFSPSSGSTFGLGMTTVNGMASDGNSNTSTCSFTVTVEDNTPPTAICVNSINFSLNQFGELAIPQVVIDNFINTGSFDNCPGELTFALSTSMFDCNNVGSNPYTLTVTDAAGNSSTCSNTINIQDNTAPNALCQDVTVQLDAGGNGSTSSAMVDNGSNDACGIASLSLDNDAFTCADLGNNTVTLTVTDVNGNSSTCTATVTVEDNIRPSISCPADETIENDIGLCSAEYTVALPNAADNCGVTVLRYRYRPVDENGNNIGPWSAWSTAATQVLDVGFWKIQWQAKDASNNQRRCSFIVTVEDTEDPVPTCPTVPVSENDPGACGAIVDFMASATDNCPGVTFVYSQNPGTFFPVGTTPVTVTATDVAGNDADCSFDVVVEDTEKPVLNCSGLNTVVTNDPGECEADVDLPVPTATDNCGVVTLEYRYRPVDDDNNALGPWTAWADASANAGTFPVGRYRIRWRAIDAAGNTQACTRFLTVVDVEPPIIDCFNQTIVFNGEASIPLLVEDLAEASDNCGIASLTLDINEVFCEQLGEEITVTATAVDVNDLVSTCTSKVQIEGLPCGWSQQPDGVGCEDGNDVDYDVPSETFTVNSTDCHNAPTTNTDEYAFAQYNLCGNGEIIAQVTNISGTSLGWAGVTMRESNDPQAKAVSFMTNLSANHRREARVTTGGTVTSQLMPSFNRHWLKIQRMGNQFRAYSSFNGLTWFLRFAQNIPMDECIEVGLVLNGYFGSGVLSATFENVSVQGTTFFEFQANNPTTELVLATPKTFSVFPNPTAGQVTIALGDFLEQEARLEVLDVNGKLVQLVREGILENSTEELNLGQLPAGLYFVRLQLADGTVQTQRVVLQPRP